MTAEAKGVQSHSPHPLHHEIFGVVKRDPRVERQLLQGRRTGRSTCIALRAIAKAIENPGVGVLLVDHHHGNQADFHLSRMVLMMVQSIGMRHLHVDEVRYRAPDGRHQQEPFCTPLLGYQLVFEVREKSL